jgi:hypothetical protein
VGPAWKKARASNPGGEAVVLSQLPGESSLALVRSHVNGLLIEIRHFDTLQIQTKKNPAN